MPDVVIKSFEVLIGQGLKFVSIERSIGILRDFFLAMDGTESSPVASVAGLLSDLAERGTINETGGGAVDLENVREPVIN